MVRKLGNWNGTHWVRALALALLLPLGAITSPGATWYAAVDGKSTNGTYADPWSVEFAVGKTRNALLKPGDTVVFKSGGTYTCSETNVLLANGRMLVFRTSGLPSAKITYMPETLWQFHFDGGLLFPHAASNLVIHGFHIYSSASTNRSLTNYSEFPCGVSVFAPGVNLLHNLIENTGHSAIGSWSSTRGKYIAGNIIRFIGDDNMVLNSGAEGSGMYLQNAANSDEALIQGNISYFNYTTAMKAYGNENVWGFKFLQNICVGNPIFYHQDQVDSQGVQIISNYIWGAQVLLGYVRGNAHPSNAVIAGNYVSCDIPPILVQDDWRNMVWSNNVAVNPYRRLVVEMGAAWRATNAYPGMLTRGNQYWAGAYTGYGTQSFLYNATEKGFSEWATLAGGETDSTLISGTPTNIVVSAFAPSRDSNFVHVAVFNWPTNESTTVDLSGYFRSGDRLRVFDIQELPVAYTNYDYNGGTVALSLNRTNIAPMLGTFAARGKWQGFDPRFRAFVIYRTGQSPRPAPPPLLRDPQP